MKKFDLKSFAAGLLIGTLGITTAFAAAGILSADLCDTKVTLKGSPLSLNHPLISVTMEDGQEPKLYMPADELLTISDITASFVIGKIGEKVFISGRSIGDINVQIILEKLGGGGHITLAGAQIEGLTLEEAKDELIIRINEYLTEIE